MNNYTAWKASRADQAEKQAVQVLIDKMGLNHAEIQEISKRYGVTASQLVERMQLSKYRFLYDRLNQADTPPGQAKVIDMGRLCRKERNEE